MAAALRGLSVVIIERRKAGEPPSAKCNTVAARTMELFRTFGIADDVGNAGLPDDYPTDTIYCTSIPGYELARLRLPSRSERGGTGFLDDGWPTPEPMVRVSQIYLEPIMFERMRALPGVTVLNETKTIDGVECRIVEERETKDGKLIEVSRNYYAIGKRTNSVYYFGEDVDIYENGKIVGHEGSWMSGKNGAKYGLMMSGLPLAGARYYQEVAPKAALDRAEIVGLGLTLKTPAGEFKNCLKIEETTPLEPDNEEAKLYAPGVGLLKDGSLSLVRYGKVEFKR